MKIKYILLIILMGSIAFVFNAVKSSSENYEVKDFSIEDYNFRVEQYNNNISLEKISFEFGKILSSEHAVNVAKTVSIKLFGSDALHKEDIEIYYDENEEIWLIILLYSKNAQGGSHSVLIGNENGDIIAVWGGK